MERKAITERDILGACEVWPRLPYPDGVSTLVEYRHGRQVNHHYPHTAPLEGFALGVAAAFYARTVDEPAMWTERLHDAVAGIGT